MSGPLTIGGIRAALTLVIAGLATACVDLTDSVGEQGRLRFTLSTEYEVEESELTDATLVAGHIQQIEVDLTAKGEEDVREPDELAYRIRPSVGVEISAEATGGNDAPDVTILAQPGSYEIEAVYKGKIVDAITLRFATPDALELAVQIRLPFEDRFEPIATDAIEVPEGTQATFLPIPKQGDRRLVGRVGTQVSASPKELVVPGEGASFVYEQSVWSAEGNIDFYFIDPGTVTITVRDPVSKASGAYTFDVTPVN